MNKSTVRGASWIAAMAFVVAPPVQASPSPGDGPESMDRYAPVPEKPGAIRATFDRPAITAVHDDGALYTIKAGDRVFDQTFDRIIGAL